MKNIDTTEKTRQHFDEIAASYAESSDSKFCAPAYDALKQEIERCPGGKLLDVSCGTGTVLSFLGQSPLEKYGVDFSEKMIEAARRDLGSTARLYVAEAEAMPFDGATFDVVTCSFAFHHYIHPAQVLREFRRVAKLGTTLIIADPYLPQPLRWLMNPLLRFSDNGDYHIYGRRELSRLMSANGFRMETFRRIDKRMFLCLCVAV